MNDELAVVAEQFRQLLLSVGGVEDVCLVDLHPGHGASLCGDEVAHAGERFLVLQVGLAGLKPFVTGYDCMVHDRTP